MAVTELPTSRAIRFRRMPLPSYVAILVLALVALAAIFGPWLSPYDAVEIDPLAALQPPSWAHWAGTDDYGRDVLTRVLVGAQSSLSLALICSAAAIVLGTAVGLVAGYYGGTVDGIVMRVMDVFLALPSLLIALLILAALGSNTLVLIAALTVMFVPPVSRVARTAAMRVSHLAYVDAARIRGESAVGIMALELLPNMVSVLAVEAGIRVSYTILNLAALGFLGLGVQPPTPDWGLMISEGSQNMSFAPWVVIAPALAIVVVVLSVNLILDEVAN
ncbi:ABC transporter permease [Martelella alba]|uniref:ABC transporter permease n=1 Tax=Martelella alba TaxID=2590451 RepID=A0A506U1G5_9HYPH|nr:ABC transporter permease [Martelella alba]TPW27336.1 ABC transporter permease [Martelella alba]